MNRAGLIQQIEDTKAVLEKLLALLQSEPLEHDRFVNRRMSSAPIFINPGGSIGEGVKLPASPVSQSNDV